MPSPSPTPALRLSCPACSDVMEVPFTLGGQSINCPACRTSVPVPEVIGWTGGDAAEPQRVLKVRTPAMPGSRLHQKESKEPPRLPKPGDPDPVATPRPHVLPPVAVLTKPALPPAALLPIFVPVTVTPTNHGTGAPGMLPAPPPTPSTAPDPSQSQSPLRAELPHPEWTATTTGTPAVVLCPSLEAFTHPKPDWRKKSGLSRQVTVFGPIIAATLLCSAAVAAWRVWPASFPFGDFSEPNDELLYHHQPSIAPPRLIEPAPAANLFEEFAAEGFHFQPPADYWERISNAASPFSLLQPAFNLRRTESSPPSEFGIAACDFSISTESLSPDSEVGDVWQNLASVNALRTRFPCGQPERYEVTSGAPSSCRFVRLVWNVVPGEGGQPARHLEMWIHQRGGIAWSLTGSMPGTTTSYSLTRTMQRLAGGFSPLDLDPELTRLSLINRDTTGTGALSGPPPPQPLHRWSALPAGAGTWPGGQFLTPGAETTWAVGPARIALVTLPPDGLEKITASRLLTGLRQLWPALRGFSLPVLESVGDYDFKTQRLLLSGRFNDAPAQCLIHWRRSPQGTVLAFAFQPDAADSPTPDPAKLLASLDLNPAGLPAEPPPSAMPSTVQLPLLEVLAGEARADGRPHEAAALHFALFNRSQRLEDLAAACSSLASGGKLEEAVRMFDHSGGRFTNTPGWELYRTVVLARLGAGPRAHRYAMELLSARRFPGSLAAPYLNALMESRSWPQAKTFVSMLVRNDPDSALWRLHYASILAETGERPKAIAIIHATQQTWPDDDILGIECVQTLLRLKALQDASAVAGRVAIAHRNHEQAQLIFGQCLTLLGRNEEARMAYQRALKAAPASPTAREAITSLAALSSQSDHDFVTAAIDPVPLPAVLLTGLPAAPALTYGPSLMLSRITGLRHQRGRLPATTVRARIHISNPEGMGQWNTLTFPIDPDRERLTLHHLNVLDRAGKVIARANLPDRYTIDAADGTSVVHFPVPGLVPGCIIDYAITTESRTPATRGPYIRHSFASPTPCLADICYVTGDTTSLTWAHSGKKEPRRTGDALIWREDRPALPTAARTDAPTLHLGTVSATWESTGRDYLEQIRHRLAPEPVIREAALRGTAGLTSRAEKVKALAARVRSDISYTAIEFGYRAIIPHAAGVTLGNRFGDCKDHAVLLHSLLTAAGIPSHLALIHSSIPVHPDFPALSQFDHMIVALPAGDGTFDFIDPTDKFLESTPGAAPTGLSARQALILDPAKSRLVATPAVEATSEGSLLREVVLEGERDACITDHLVLTGPAAANLRSLLAPLPPGGQLPALQRLLGLDRLREQLLEVSLTALRDPSQPLEARLVWQCREALRPAPGGQQLFLSTPLADYLLFPAAFNPASASGPLSINAPLRLKTTITFSPAQQDRIQAPSVPQPAGSGPQGRWTTSTAGSSLTWTVELQAGTWSGPDAIAACRFPVEALQPLRQPWFVTPVPSPSPTKDALPVLSREQPAPESIPSQN